MTKLQTLTVLHFLMLSSETREQHLFSWISKTFRQSVQPLLEKSEEDLENVIMKLLKLSEIERRFFDKVAYKDKTISEANKLLLSVDSLEIKAFISSTQDRWNNLHMVLKNQRKRLDEIASTWREFNVLAEYLEQWLSITLISVQTDVEHCNIDSVRLEQEVLQNIEQQFKTRYRDKETLKKMKESVVNCINNKPCKSIELQMGNIETLWLELKKAMHERMRLLADLSNEVEWININEMVLSLTKSINQGEELLGKYTSKPAVTSDELDDEISLFEVRNLHQLFIVFTDHLG